MIAAPPAGQFASPGASAATVGLTPGGPACPTAFHAIGVSFSNFASRLAEQGSLFDEREAGRRAALFQAFDGVRREFGHGVLVSGRALHLKGRLEEDQHGFVLRTPSLTK